MEVAIVMLIFVELSYMPKERVMKLKDNLCLSEEESQIFDMTVFQDKSAQQMADKLHKSTRTIFRIMSRIRTKILNELEYERYCERLGKTAFEMSKL